MKTATDWMRDGKSARSAHLHASLEYLSLVVDLMRDIPRPKGQGVLSDDELLHADAARLAGTEPRDFVSTVVRARAAGSQDRADRLLRTPMTSAEAGAAFGPTSCDSIPELPRATFAAPGRITVRDFHRRLDAAGIAHTPATGRDAQLVRNRSPR